MEEENNLVRLPVWIVISIIAMSAAGLAVSARLAVRHYTIGSLEYRLTENATLFGLPIAVLAILYFIIFLMSGLLYMNTKNLKIVSLFFPLGLIGLLTSIWIGYLQVFQIKEICVFHTILIVTTVILFVLSLFPPKIPTTPKELTK